MGTVVCMYESVFFVYVWKCVFCVCMKVCFLCMYENVFCVCMKVFFVYVWKCFLCMYENVFCVYAWKCVFCVCMKVCFVCMYESVFCVCMIVCLFVGCLTSQQQASVSQGRICLDNFTCCHTEIEVADQTFYLTQSQYTDTGPTSPSADPITPGAWQGSHWSANF